MFDRGSSGKGAFWLIQQFLSVDPSNHLFILSPIQKEFESISRNTLKTMNISEKIGEGKSEVRKIKKNQEIKHTGLSPLYLQNKDGPQFSSTLS